jgi:DNA-binding GntR family transcriptional regulator
MSMPKTRPSLRKAGAANSRVTEIDEPDRVMDETEIAESLSQIAWQAMRDAIISGKLAPKSRLRIAKLRDMFGIGASPLREALSRLVADGLVISLDRRGFMVAPISLAEFRDLTDMRKLLEKEALRLALLHGDDAWESRVIAAFHRLGKAQQRVNAQEPDALEEWERLNEEAHEALVSACPSQWLLRFRRTVYAYTTRYRRICLSVTTVARDVQSEHRKLRDAALARDIAQVHKIIDEHLERTFRKALASGKLTDTSTLQIAPSRRPAAAKTESAGSRSRPRVTKLAARARPRS